MFYNAIKTKLIKLKHYSRVWIHDLFTPFDTILATIVFVITLSVSSYIAGGYGSSKEFDDNIRIGVISSTLVAIIIETQSNLRFNTRRHSELAEYFLTLTLLKAELDGFEKKEYDIDPVKIIWSNLPKLIRVLKGVNESKLEWLTSTESRTIQNILTINQMICHDLGNYIEDEIHFHEVNFLLNQNIFAQTISDMPKEMVKEIIRKKKREEIDELVQTLFFEGSYANYALTKKVCVVSDYYVGNPSIDSIEKNVLSENCFEILQEVRILFPYLIYEKINLTMEIIKKKNK